MKLKLTLVAVLAALAGAMSGAAQAEIVVGVSLGITGPGASLGVHYRNAFQLMGKTLGGEPVRYVILDDGSDPTNAAKNARKLIAEEKADVLLGSNGVPSAVQMAQAAAEAKIPMLVMTPAVLSGEVLHWSFVVPQPTELMMSAVSQQLKAHGVKTVGYIGFSDVWGDLVYKAIQSQAGEYGYKI
ncbi:MAG TPA: ABC transporter substrate-binding protein, partial [Burkholderiales bacterium]|nr:ABC transporter substrate-binding protein [Burkholderiales bacterium]